MNYKILNNIGNKFTKDAKTILGQIGQVDYCNLNRDELIKKIGEYNILIVNISVMIDQEIIDKGKKLKIIITPTTGLDHIDVEYAKAKGIEIISLRGETEFLNTITGTAELAFGLIINILRSIPSAFFSVKKYNWERENFRGYNLYNKTIGIVGLGRLGSWLAKYAKAFNMKVIAYDPDKDDQYFKERKVKKVDFNELLEKSDIISIHVHLNNDTENMFNKTAFSKMKNTAYLINTSRGKVVNEEDLLITLENKKIAGYATDVLANEINFSKDFSNHPLIEYAKTNNNLIIVPHIGGMTHESRQATDIFIAEKIKARLNSSST